MSSSRRKRDPKEPAAGQVVSQAVPESAAFEDQLRRLELLVERMEGEDLKLEEAIGLFEEGMGLSKTLLDRLEKAEKRVEILVRKSRTEVEKRSLDADAVMDGGGLGGDDEDTEDEDIEGSDEDDF